MIKVPLKGFHWFMPACFAVIVIIRLGLVDREFFAVVSATQ